LVQEGKLVPNDKGNFYAFAEDVPFASPSAAAAVVFDGNQNGRIAWKVKRQESPIRSGKNQN
jgi:hypothetical protein